MLSVSEIAQLKAIMIREGGIEKFAALAQTAYVAMTQASAATLLAPAITVTVQDWPALGAYVAQSTNATLYSVMDAITKAAAAKDATQLGPLFVALYAAVKVHLGL